MEDVENIFKLMCNVFYTKVGTVKKEKSSSAAEISLYKIFKLRTSFLADKVFRDLDGDEIFIANLTSTQRQGQLINNNETYTVDFNPKGEVSFNQNQSNLDV